MVYNMGAIISLFEWVIKLVTTAVKWVSDVPGKIVLFVTTFITAVVNAVGVLSSNLSSVVSFFTSASAKVSAVGQAAQSHAAGSLLIHVLSLDVAFSLIVSVLGIFLAVVGGIFITLFAYAVTAYIVPIALKIVLKCLSVLSAGFVKM